MPTRIRKFHTRLSPWRRSLAGLCVVLLSAPVPAGLLLTPHTAEYKVKIRVLGGRLTTQLEATPDGYVASHVIKPTGMSRMFARGMISESSDFYSAPDGIRPREYWSRDTLSRDKENVRVSFDWETGEARGTVNGEDVLSVMDALAHDRISIQYQLMHDLLRGELSVEYTMFEIDRLRTVNVRKIGEKTITVPAGQFEVVGLQHQAEGSKRVTTLWCAAQLGYLPVVIEQHRKGKLRVRATLSEYAPIADP